VKWKLDFRVLKPKGSLNKTPDETAKFGPRPKEDEWLDGQYQTWIDLPTSRIRNESSRMTYLREGDGNYRLLREKSVNLFDGKNLQSATVGEVLTERDPSGFFQGLVFEAMQSPLFWGMGIVFGADRPFSIHQLNASIDAEKYRVHEILRDGNGTRVIVRSYLDPNADIYVEYVIDIDKDCAVTAKTMKSNGRLYSELNAVWSQTDRGWQPATWMESIYRPDGTLLIAGDCKVVESVCAPDLRDVEFHINVSPGTVYSDQKTNSFLVKSPPGQPDVPKELYDIQSGAKTRRYLWMLSAAILVTCLVGAAWWYRRSGSN
jgi:hypothetical protein